MSKQTQAVFNFLHNLLHLILPHLPTAISSLIFAVLFLLHQAFTALLSTPIQKSTTVLTLPTTPPQTLSTTIYTSPSTPTTHTILILHGLSSTAENDPRIVSLATALIKATPSATILVPHIPFLSQIKLSRSSIPLLSTLLQTVHSSPHLCPTTNLSLVSACISAGLALVAAAFHPHPLHSILAIGPHASVHAVIRHAIIRDGFGDCRYAINAALASFLHNGPVLRDMLVASVVDDHLANLGQPATTLQSLLNKFPQEAVQFRRLHDDPSYMAACLHRIQTENYQFFNDMSPIRCLDRLRCAALVLVHARRDDIVPPKESVTLANAMRGRRDVRTRLCVTDLLNHGDQRELAWSDVPDVLRLVFAFAAFFRTDFARAGEKDKVL